MIDMFMGSEMGVSLPIIDSADTDRNVWSAQKTKNEIGIVDDKVEELQLYKFPNAIIYGQPTINNGQISGFSNDNYLGLPFVFDTKDRGFEINVAFTTNSDVTTAQNIFGSKFCIALYIQNGQLVFRAGNGSDWSVADITTTLSVQANTTYYVKIAFNKLNYTISYSTNGEDYESIGSKVTTIPPTVGQVNIGIGNNQHNPFNGIINLNKTFIKLNNTVVWEGMDDVGLATRLTTDLENIDEVGIDRVKEITNLAETDIKMLGWSVPKDCPIQNEVNGNTFIQKVDRVDLGTLDWEYNQDYVTPAFRVNKKVLNTPSNSVKCFAYGYTAKEKFWENENEDKCIGTGVNFFNISNLEYTDVNEFKEAVKGVYLYYERGSIRTNTIDGMENTTCLVKGLGNTTNLIKPSRVSSITKAGVTCTPNGDGTYTLNGTSTGNANIELSTAGVDIPQGEYRLVGSPKGASTTTFRLGVTMPDGNVFDYGNGRKLSVKNDGIGKIFINIASSDIVFENVVFKPMISTNQNATYDDYVPYTGDTGRLNNDVAVIKEDVDNLQSSQGRNLLPYPYWNQSALLRGINYTINDDGSVNCNGTATGGVANFVFFDNRTSNVPNLIKKDVEYTLSSTNQIPTRVNFAIRTYDSSKAILEQFTITNDLNNVKVKITKDFVYSTMYIAIGDGVTVDNLVIYPMLEKGSSVHSYEPTVESNVSILSQEKLTRGRNLITYPYYMPSGSVNNGITYTVNDDGSITANGTASADSFFNMSSRTISNWYLKAGKYTLSGNPSQDNNKIRLVIGGNSSTGTGENIAIDYGKGVTFEITEESAQRTKQVLLMIVRGETVNNLTFYPQLEEGTIAHTYEPTTESNISLVKASTFPSGDMFYLDEKDGVKGYNTDPQRGADTFHPFSSGGGLNIIEQTFASIGEYTIDTPSRAKKIIWFSTASGSMQVIYDEDLYTNKYFYGYANTYGITDIANGKYIEAVNDNSVVIKTNQANVKCLVLY